MNLTLEEIKGIERELELLISKLNRVKESRAIETDPSVLFKLEHNIEAIEGLVRDRQKRLSSMYNFHTYEGESVLAAKIRQLRIKERLGVLHVVNCDRKEMKNRFWAAFDRCISEQFSFYFVSACPTQMPPSFSERMIYEFVLSELGEQIDQLYELHRRPDSERLHIYDLPIGRNLELCKVKWNDFFLKKFRLPTNSSFKEYLQTGLPSLQCEYVAMVFSIHENTWEDFLPDYFEWILKNHRKVHSSVPKFMIFFVCYIEDLHTQNLNTDKNMILSTLQYLVKSHPNANLLSPLAPVPVSDLKAWIMELGETNDGRIEEVIQSMANGLQGRDREQYFSARLLNMDDIERFQEIVYQVVNSDAPTPPVN